MRIFDLSVQQETGVKIRSSEKD